MKDKKGAIELSMTTIIVIVIGITLLSLGLVWVNGLFDKLEGLSAGAFAHADDEIAKIGQANQPLTISPSSIELETKKNDAIGVVVANLESGDDITVTIRAISEDSSLRCGFPKGDKLVGSVGPFTISSGNQESQVLGIIDDSGKIRLTSCDIIVDGLPGDNTATVLIDVIKK